MHLKTTDAQHSWNWYLLCCCATVLFAGCSEQKGVPVPEFDPPASSEFDPDELEEARETLTPLQFAVEYGTYEDVVRALQENPDSINETEEYGNTALHMAVHQGKVKVVELLLKSGADINARGDYDETPLQVALKDESDEIVRLLLKNGADPNNLNVFGNRPLSYVGDSETIDMLVEHGAEVDLPIVMLKGDFERVRRMLAEDPNLVRSLHPKVRQDILNRGISMICGRFDLEMEQKFGQPINPLFTSTDAFKQKFGEEFDLHFRKVIAENRDILETLIAQGAPRTIPHQELDLALTYDQAPLVELLLEYGAEFPAEDDHRWSFIAGPHQFFGLSKIDKPQLIEKYKKFIKK
ncbi:ankyrin repeat domain-containing protein [Gimesia maris]|uniref:ankyrin repeat domain-containing protein n=1 Tax=Gimesia maris TaxID=122 RepID=UPI00241D425B|nr:ankyrin repeat domain-containing protein [Gimesia maris]|tara:strand:- start:348855 stop:349910 length:1056 start_codon:yes stop_codon:yes gene_type:complete